MKKGLVNFFVLALILFSFISFVSASPTDEVKDFLSGTVNFIKDAGGGFLESLGFGAFGGGGADAFAQALLMFITIMLVYSVIGFLGFFGEGKDWINWLISIAAGFLGFLYIDASWIRTLADQYQFMAIALNILLPWGIVVAFIWRLQFKAFEGEGKINPEVANIITWLVGGGLIAYLIFKIFSDPLFVGLVRTISWIAVGALIGFLFFKRKIILAVVKGSLQKLKNKSISAATKLGSLKDSNQIVDVIRGWHNGDFPSKAEFKNKLILAGASGKRADQIVKENTE